MDEMGPKLARSAIVSVKAQKKGGGGSGPNPWVMPVVTPLRVNSGVGHRME